MSARVAAEIQGNLDFIIPNATTSTSGSKGSNLRLLDYACGTGAITLALGHVCSEAVGIDISSKMVERYYKLMREHAPSNLKVSVYEGNLFATEGPPESLQAPSLYDFDIAAVGLGFHHFDSPSLCIKLLAERLKPGGVILIVDLCDDGNKLIAKPGITANSFSEQRMKEIFEGESLTNVGYHQMSEAVELKMSEVPINKTIFLGRATKPFE